MDKYKSCDYMFYLIPYIAEIIVSDKLTDAQRELQFNAILRLQGILKYYEKLGYRGDLICRIAEKKGAMICQVTTKSEMLKLLKPDCPHYDGNKFITGKYNVPEEELICWSEVSLKAGGPLISAACERYISLFKSVFPDIANDFGLIRREGRS